MTSAQQALFPQNPVTSSSVHHIAENRIADGMERLRPAEELFLCDIVFLVERLKSMRLAVSAEDEVHREIQPPARFVHSAIVYLDDTGNCFLCHRILNAQSFEPSEVRVSRNHNKPVFHCERGKMRIRNKLVVYALYAHKRIEKRHVPFGRNRNPHTWRFKPCVNLPPCIGNGYCRLKYSWIRRQSDKRRNAFPRNAKRNIIVVQRTVKPLFGLFMLRKGVK
jgi:hypothetical protein